MRWIELPARELQDLFGAQWEQKQNWEVEEISARPLGMRMTVEMEEEDCMASKLTASESDHLCFA